jgi:hypothetical protein
MARSLYVIGSDTGPQKIGVSANVARRLAVLQTHSPHALTAHHQAQPASDARLVERVAHALLAAKRLRGEWFDVSVEDAIAAIDQAIALVDSGGHRSLLRQPITFTLPPDLIAEIDAVAAAEDRSRAKMIEIGMRQFVQSYNRRAAA